MKKIYIVALIALLILEHALFGKEPHEKLTSKKNVPLEEPHEKLTSKKNVPLEDVYNDIQDLLNQEYCDDDYSDEIEKLIEKNNSKKRYLDYTIKLLKERMNAAKQDHIRSPKDEQEYEELKKNHSYLKGNWINYDYHSPEDLKNESKNSYLRYLNENKFKEGKQSRSSYMSTKKALSEMRDFIFEQSNYVRINNDDYSICALKSPTDQCVMTRNIFTDLYTTQYE